MLVNPHPFQYYSIHLLQCMFSVCELDNMNSNATNKNCTSPKWVHTQAPNEQAQEPKMLCSSTPSSPMKATKDALKLAVASLSTSLQPHNPLSTSWA